MDYNNFKIVEKNDTHVKRTTILDCLTLYDCQNKFRLGNQRDGGYIIAELNVKYDIILGGGVGNDIGFEKIFTEKYDVSAAVFDATEQSGFKLTENEPNILYKNLNISQNNTSTTTNWENYFAIYNNIFIKMDIEGAEWNYFNALPVQYLLKIAQLTIEFHFPRTASHFKILEKIAQTHYLIHFHANNNNQIIYRVEGTNPAVFECTYVRKDLVPKLSLNKEKLPTKLDTPNVSSKPDHIIDYYPFVHH
jgi:hypothetical protein